MQDRAMNPATSPSAAALLATPERGGLAQALAWRRLVFIGVLVLLWSGFQVLVSETRYPTWLLRTSMVAFGALLAFGLLEQWPARLPPWLARWALQIAGVMLAMPIGAFVSYCLTSPWPFWDEPKRIVGFAQLSIVGAMFGPWIALTAMLRQREAFMRTQALAFALERSELERQALDARLRLVQAQVQPHFLFNTLANVRALVTSGSPRAGPVLDSLVAYLRAAVPRLASEGASTVQHEVQLVRAYLELMQLRMPDRLRFTLDIDPVALPLPCPPTTLLTLVENAVRHGIDPNEDGGEIAVAVRVEGGRCKVRVADTGAGLGRDDNPGLGTGLASLRERLRLAFGDDVLLTLNAASGGGTQAEASWKIASP
jgi:signal transduction histidine kinase